MSMTFREFMNAMMRPTFVWQMANALLGYRADPDVAGRTAIASAPKRAANAARDIDDLVRQRARELGMVDPDDAVAWQLEDRVGAVQFRTRHDAERFAETHTLDDPVLCAIIPLRS